MAGECCLKFIIITFNIIFGLIGVAFLGVGLFVKFGSGGLLETALNATFSSVQGLGGNLGVDNYDGSGGFDISELAELLDPVVMTLIIFGAFLLIIVLLGSLGVCCKISIALWLYAIIIIVILLVQLILVILFFTGALDGQVKTQFNDIIKKDYVASDAYDIHSVMWNVMNQKLKCCGVDNYEDFHAATKWNRTREVNGIVVYLQTPFSCCKPDASDYHCAEAPTEATNYLNTGCFQELWDSIDQYKPMTIGAISVVLLLQLLCAIGAIVIAKKNNEVAP